MSTVQAMQMYCVSDPDYYENPDRLDDAATRYPWSQGSVPAGWRRSAKGLWTELRPLESSLPEQGWKIHLSTVPERAVATLDAVALICLPRLVPFKFLRSADALRLAVDKYMPRASSGKFVTVYPADERQFAELVGELDATLAGSPGPYILSDLRIGRGPVYVRYGAFVELWCLAPHGARVPALRDPAGTLVPDHRGPAFRLPPWVRPPEVLRPHLAARGVGVDADFPYRVVRALHFTNAGGIYLARHKDTGQRVVLREARPHSGLDGAGTDAVTRLRREHAALTKLYGLAFVPRVWGIRTVWEHEILIEEYIEGVSLLTAVISRYPLRFVEPSAESIAAYARWVETIVVDLSRALDAMHARGVSFGDLHPSNVIVRPDDSVALVDFEYAGDTGASGAPRIGAPGFTAPREATNAEADRYSLRSIRLMMLMPLVELADRDPGKTATLEELACRRFGLTPDAPGPRVIRAAPEVDGEAVVRELFDSAEPHWPSIRDQLATGILAAATPDRTDRLYPGDPNVFDGQGAALVHGAAGVLRVLHQTGVEIPTEHVDWLVAAARRVEPRVGLFDGLYGIAVVLHELGRPNAAAQVLSRCRDAAVGGTPDLFSGQAGVALGQCHLAGLTGDGMLLDRAARIAQRLDSLARDDSDWTLELPAAAGLLRGMSGAALLHLRLYRITSDESHLRACRRALSHDLKHCVPIEDGTVQVKAGHRHLIYLDGGSGGIALVAREYLTHRDDAELADFLSAVRRGCGHEHVREPGLWQGRAGLLAVLGRLAGPDAGEETLRQVRRLGWHTVYRAGTLLIPGRHLRRFSADLATGSAGVLLALHAQFEGSGDVLPLLVPGA